MSKKRPPLQPVDLTPKFFVFNKFSIATFEPEILKEEDKKEIEKLVQKISKFANSGRMLAIYKKKLKTKLGELGLETNSTEALLSDVDNFLTSVDSISAEMRAEALKDSLVKKIADYFEMEARILSGKKREGDERMKVLQLSMFKLKLEDGNIAHVYAHSNEHYDKTKH